MQSWRDNKTLRFAVGVTLTVLLIRWLLTGDLLFAVQSATEPADEGKTKSVTMLAALWPMFFEAMVIVGTAAIAWAFRLWDLIYGLINPSPPTESQPQVVVQASAVLAVESQPLSADSLVQGLARAAATNDTATMNKLKVQIRKPYALDELNQAYNEGDAKRAESLTKELNSMIAKGQSNESK